mgnify:CR=1 FL=1
MIARTFQPAAEMNVLRWMMMMMMIRGGYLSWITVALYTKTQAVPDVLNLSAKTGPHIAILFYRAANVKLDNLRLGNMLLQLSPSDPGCFHPDRFMQRSKGTCLAGQINSRTKSQD